MVYIVRAVLVGRGSTLRAELETRQAATRSAKELREEGFQVTITDPNGSLVDETEDERGCSAVETDSQIAGISDESLSHRLHRHDARHEQRMKPREE
jgi:hypothetical protein